MNDKAKKRKRAWRYFAIFLVLIVGIPLLLLFMGTIWVFARQQVAAGDLAERKAELRSRGVPVDLPSLQETYEKSTSPENEAAWVAICDRIESDEFTAAAKFMPFYGAYEDELLENDEMLGMSDIVERKLIVVPPPGEDWPDRERVLAFLKNWNTEFDQLTSLGVSELDRDQPTRRPIVFS